MNKLIVEPTPNGRLTPWICRQVVPSLRLATPSRTAIQLLATMPISFPTRRPSAIQSGTEQRGVGQLRRVEDRDDDRHRLRRRGGLTRTLAPTDGVQPEPSRFRVEADEFPGQDAIGAEASPLEQIDVGGKARGRLCVTRMARHHGQGSDTSTRQSQRNAGHH